MCSNLFILGVPFRNHSNVVSNTSDPFLPITSNFIDFIILSYLHQLKPRPSGPNLEPKKGMTGTLEPEERIGETRRLPPYDDNYSSSGYRRHLR